jgi:hypothetical protein
MSLLKISCYYKMKKLAKETLLQTHEEKNIFWKLSKNTWMCWCLLRGQKHSISTCDDVIVKTH